VNVAAGPLLAFVVWHLGEHADNDGCLDDCRVQVGAITMRPDSGHPVTSGDQNQWVSPRCLAGRVRPGPQAVGQPPVGQLVADQAAFCGCGYWPALNAGTSDGAVDQVHEHPAPESCKVLRGLRP
jgi:hypothetical protein